MKIGFASDIHRLVKNRKLLLGGICIPYTLGEDAFSDGDVVLHSISEAIFGALGIGDLGDYFPDTDLKNKDLDSSNILIFANKKMNELSMKVSNIDVSIYLEMPKIYQYKRKIKENIAKILKVDSCLINVKACTNEGLDSIGTGKAVKCDTIVLLEEVK